MQQVIFVKDKAVLDFERRPPRAFSELRLWRDLGQSLEAQPQQGRLPPALQFTLQELREIEAKSRVAMSFQQKETVESGRVTLSA